MASKNPEINRLIQEVINNEPSRDERLRMTNPAGYQKIIDDRERATVEYLSRLWSEQIRTRIELEKGNYMLDDDFGEEDYFD